MDFVDKTVVVLPHQASLYSWYPEKSDLDRGASKVITNGISFRSMFLHAWDLADDGLEEVLGSTRDAGLNTLCLAATYHHGWFIHPHNRRHRAFMTEGSVCYFRPQDSLYQDTKLRPQLAKLSGDKDWFAEAGRQIDRYGLRMVAWTVGAHNSRLGFPHPTIHAEDEPEPGQD